MEKIYEERYIDALKVIRAKWDNLTERFVRQSARRIEHNKRIEELVQNVH